MNIKLVNQIVRGFILLLLIMLVACQSKEPPASFLVFSDIHFNPFNSCNPTAKTCHIVERLVNSPIMEWDVIFAKYDNHLLNTYRDDTSPALLDSMLSYIQKQGNRYQFALLTGDFLAHDYQQLFQQYTGDMSDQDYQQFVAKTNQYLIYRLRQTLPNTSVYVAIGNNDSYHGHYYTNPGGPFYKMMVEQWQDLIVMPENKMNYRQSAPYAGYYAIVPTSDKKNMIVILNTNLLSTNAIGYNVPIAAKLQLMWLEHTLKNAAKNKAHVIIVSHIPFGINANKAAKVIGTIPVLWQAQYQEQFMNILNRYPGVVTDMISGHFHMDGFEILHMANGQRLLNSMVPGVSSISGNNSAFKVYQYNQKTFQLLNFQTYYLNPTNNKWQLEYDFSNAYQPFCLHCTLLDGYSKLQLHTLRAIEYQKYFGVKTTSQPITNKVTAPYYYCGILEQTEQDYQECLKKQNTHLKM
jgi:hypothetical protein